MLANIRTTSNDTLHTGDAQWLKFCSATILVNLIVAHYMGESQWAE